MLAAVNASISTPVTFSVFASTSTVNSGPFFPETDIYTFKRDG